MVRFGPAGNDSEFYASGAKSTSEAPKWLCERGLNAYEYQGGNGIRISEEKARNIGFEAKMYDIELSIHAPYYISFASSEKEKRENSIMYIMQSLQAAQWMDAKRVVFHPGSVGKMSRPRAMELALEIMPRVIRAQDERGFGSIELCPEVMGKINQLGTVDEIIELCKLDDRLIPTVDFGHVNARTQGGLKAKEDFARVLDQIEFSLGNERMRRIHVHFSHIEYTKGGEKRHLTFDDDIFGPDFRPFAELIVERNMEPIVICESKDSQMADALKMKDYYESLLDK